MSTQNLQKLKGWKAQIQQFMHILGSTPTTSQDLAVNPLRLWKKVSSSMWFFLRDPTVLENPCWSLNRPQKGYKEVSGRCFDDFCFLPNLSSTFWYLSTTPSPINSAIPLRTLQRTAVSTDDKLLLSPGLLSRCLDGPALMIRLVNVQLSMVLSI